MNCRRNASNIFSQNSWGPTACVDGALLRNTNEKKDKKRNKWKRGETFRHTTFSAAIHEVVLPLLMYPYD